MGYQRHNTIVVASFNANAVEKAHKQAVAMFRWVSEISPEQINGYKSFFIPPDGSKEGWEASVVADSQREAFMDWCETLAHKDGSNVLCVIDASFAGDGDGAIDREI